jgi:GNAT superfamily N-acetyltransferase
MSADHIEIRRLAQEDAADAVLYRDIRLEALQANPEAFGSTFEVENALPLSLFSDRLGSSTVRPTARNVKVGRRLVEAVCDHARQQVELIQLSVVLDNEPVTLLRTDGHL